MSDVAAVAATAAGDATPAAAEAATPTAAEDATTGAAEAAMAGAGEAASELGSVVAAAAAAAAAIGAGGTAYGSGAITRPDGWAGLAKLVITSAPRAAM